MITKPNCVRKFSSAKYRFLKPVIMSFFRNEFPKLFGPVIRAKLADELINLFECNYPSIQHLKPGQLLWNALDKNTRGDSPNRKFVPVILSIITPEDIELLEKGVFPSVVIKQAIARVFIEAYQQGGILSTRDVALITLRPDKRISAFRIDYEKEHQVILPHTGALHDMGTTITHKAAIITKVIIEKKDPAAVAQECNHSQRAVDRYLKDYNRVKTVFENNQDIYYINQVTGIAKHVIKQYINILQIENEHLANY